MSAPTNTALPVATIDSADSDNVFVGDTITVTNGTWTDSPTSFTYRWRHSDVPETFLEDDHSNSYTVQESDVGHNISIRVAATNGTGTSDFAVAAQVFPNLGVVQNTGYSPPGIQSWLKADDITGLSEGDSVSTWAAAIGPNGDGTVGTTPPTLHEGVVNGLPGVRFDGSSGIGTIMASTPPTALVSGEELTAFAIIVRRGAHDNSAALLLITDAVFGGGNDYDNVGSAIVGYEEGGSKQYDYRNDAGMSGFTNHPGNDVPYILISTWDGTNSRLRRVTVGGIEDATPVPSTGSFAITRIILGARLTGFYGNIANQDYVEVGACDQALTGADLDDLTNYLQIRAGFISPGGAWPLLWKDGLVPYDGLMPGVAPVPGAYYEAPPVIDQVLTINGSVSLFFTRQGLKRFVASGIPMAFLQKASARILIVNGSVNPFFTRRGLKSFLVNSTSTTLLRKASTRILTINLTGASALTKRAQVSRIFTSITARTFTNRIQATRIIISPTTAFVGKAVKATRSVVSNAVVNFTTNQLATVIQQAITATVNSSASMTRLAVKPVTIVTNAIASAIIGKRMTKTVQTTAINAPMMTKQAGLIKSAIANSLSTMAKASGKNIVISVTVTSLRGITNVVKGFRVNAIVSSAVKKRIVKTVGSLVDTLIQVDSAQRGGLVPLRRYVRARLGGRKVRSS